MSDSLIYLCLVQLMKILDSRERNNPQMKQFYHSHLVLKHFLEGKQLFNPKHHLYKTYINYYQSRWIIKDQVDIDQTDSRVFLKQIQKLKDKQKLCCQIIVNILIMGLQSLLNIQSQAQLTSPIIKGCKQLHFTLVFDGYGISQVLLPFVQKMTKQISNLIFYEGLLKIFRRLDYHLIITFLEKELQKFRQEWNKNQQDMKVSMTKKKNRQSIFMPQPNRNLSLNQKQKTKQNIAANNIQKQTHKSKQKQKEPAQSTFKITKTLSKAPPSSRRRTFHQNNGYVFRQSTSNFFASNENFSFQQKKISQTPILNVLQSQSNNVFYEYSQSNLKIDETQIEVLAENTPQKKKKKNLEQKIGFSRVK